MDIKCFNPSIRQTDLGWIYLQIQHQFRLYNQFRDMSSLLYTCYEIRNFLEKSEYEIVILSTLNSELNDINIKAEKNMKNVIDKYKDKVDSYVVLIEKIQILTQYPLPSNKYNTQDSYLIREKMNKYLHPYLCKQDDFEFGSMFSDEIIKTIHLFFDFINSTCLMEQYGLYYAGIWLKQNFENLFENSKTNDSNALLEKIKELHIRNNS
jgi:hypothetical protein